MGRWGVCLACCFLNFVHLGVGRMSGLLYLAAAQRYGASRSEAAAPFFLCYTVRNVSGPLIGYLGRRVELRLLIVSGCVLAAVGAGSCFFAQDITTVTALWGGVFGLGFGMATMLIPQVLNQHFDRYTTIANGISFGGECIAGFVLPLLIKFLQNTYGTSGLFLILSSLILHSVPAAMLLKPPQRRSPKVNMEKSIKTVESDIHEGTSISSNRCLTSCSNSNLSSGPESDKGKSSHCDSNVKNSNSCSVYSNKNDEKVYCDVQDCRKRECFHNDSLIPFEYKLDTNECKTYHNRNDPDKKIFHQKEYHHQGHENCHYNKTTDNVLVTDSSKTHKPFSDSLRVFLNPSFILILITQSSVIYVGTMLLTIVVDYCQDNGLSEGDQVYVLMSFSTADMLGRFGLGWIADGGYMFKNHFFAICYFCMGLSLGILAFLKSFTVVLIATFFAGLSLGGLLIVGPGIISDFMEKNLVTMALASRFVLYAPMSLTQFPLIGFFRGTYGSYDWILCLLTFICWISAILSLFLPFSKRCQGKKS